MLSVENLTALGENKLHSDKRDVFFWKEDWNTKGDWCERYGRDYALLCATNAPRDDYFTVFLIKNFCGRENRSESEKRRRASTLDSLGMCQ